MFRCTTIIILKKCKCNWFELYGCFSLEKRLKVGWIIYEVRSIHVVALKQPNVELEVDSTQDQMFQLKLELSFKFKFETQFYFQSVLFFSPFWKQHLMFNKICQNWRFFFLFDKMIKFKLNLQRSLVTLAVNCLDYLTMFCIINYE
jgi:hypothetical protein